MQRQAAETAPGAMVEDEDKDEATVQRRVAGERLGTDAPSARAGAEGGAGGGLPRWLQGSIAGLSGHDLSDVRVHRNSDAPANVGAVAYAQGSHIYLGPGQDHHLAHEAWHVVQQREGRVRTTGYAHGAAINDDPGLEAEADRMSRRTAVHPAGGADTRHRPARAMPALAAPAIQRVAPAFLGLSAATWELAGTVTGIAATAASAGAGAYQASVPGENEFASVNLPANVMSDDDRAALHQITQYRIINAYVARYLAENPHVRAQLNRPNADRADPSAVPGADAPPAAQPAEPAAPATQPPAPAAAPASPATPGQPGAVTIPDNLNGAMLTAVRNNIDLELQALFRGYMVNHYFEAKWGEDGTWDAGFSRGGAGAAESVGVTGYLTIRNLDTTAIRETLTLSADAKKALGNLADEGQRKVVRQIIGGHVSGRVVWSAWDNLKVKIQGGNVQVREAASGGVQLVLYTEWFWGRWGPDSRTEMETYIDVLDSGTPQIRTRWIGAP